MTHIQHFAAPEGMRPGVGYSHGVAARGNLLAIAGQVAMDENGDLVGPSDTARPPASTAVQVVALFRTGYLLEIEALAVVKD